MSQTPRELVRRALTFETPERIPRHMWLLPWAQMYMPDVVKEINTKYPDDIIEATGFYRPSLKQKGDRYGVGTFTDDWGCVFRGVQAGIHGEVKHPILTDLNDLTPISPPVEMLPDNEDEFRDAVNRFCAETDKFVIAGCLPRPWEQYQFMRGTEDAMMDIMAPDEGCREALEIIHDFYMREVELWSSTDVDAIWFMDDWGEQRQLLIRPSIWSDLFKPFYKDYCDLAHKNGKFAMMHSDGNIMAIYQDLIEVGVDAINSQLFVMDMEELGRIAKGKIAFWGEIDRQHVLTSPDPQVGIDAVETVAKHLYSPRGGIIAQFELGPGTAAHMPETIFETWNTISKNGGHV